MRPRRGVRTGLPAAAAAPFVRPGTFSPRSRASRARSLLEKSPTLAPFRLLRPPVDHDVPRREDLDVAHRRDHDAVELRDRLGALALDVLAELALDAVQQL